MDVPTQLPVLVVSDMPLFPGAMQPFRFTEPRPLRMLSDALHSHRMMVVSVRRPWCKRDLPSQISGMGLIRACVTHRNGQADVIMHGLCRVKIQETIRLKPYRENRVEVVSSGGEMADVDLSGLVSQIRLLAAKRLKQGITIDALRIDKSLPPLDNPQVEELTTYLLKNFLAYLSTVDDPGQIADLVACTLLPKARDRQFIMESLNVRFRLEGAINFLKEEIRKRPQPN